MLQLLRLRKPPRYPSPPSPFHIVVANLEVDLQDAEKRNMPEMAMTLYEEVVDIRETDEQTPTDQSAT